MAATHPDVQAQVAEEDGLRLMVEGLSTGDSKLLFRIGTAILEVIRDNGRNQEETAMLDGIRAFVRILRTSSKETWYKEPFVEILGILQAHCGVNYKILSGVANAVYDLADLVKQCWTPKKGVNWVIGGVQAGKLMLSFAASSKANETTVKQRLDQNSAIDGVWYKWLQEQVKLHDAEGWTLATGVGAFIRGNDGRLWGKVVGDGGKVWKLESGRIAKKDTEGTKWYWRDAQEEPGP